MQPRSPRFVLVSIPDNERPARFFLGRCQPAPPHGQRNSPRLADRREKIQAMQLGVLVNWNVPRIKEGMKRMVNGL
jgi:hypothetical protein